MITIYDGRESFYQWDTNRKVVCTTSNVGDKIHFYNGQQTNALVTVVYKYNGKLVADVPNILLQKSSPIIVYKVILDDDGCSTIDKYIFEVNQRVKPESYVYTETETFSYELLDARLTELEGEGLANAVAEYLEKNPIESGATDEQVKQIEQNTKNIEKLSLDIKSTGDTVNQLSDEKLDKTALPTAVNDALAQAKASGEFDGAPGKDGEDGKDGYTPVKGVDYFDGKDGQDGKDGATGPAGAAGKTPEKGVDYWTQADQTAIVNDVLAALPTWTGGAY